MAFAKMNVIPKSYTVASCITGVFSAPNLLIGSELYIKIIVAVLILSLLSPLFSRNNHKLKRQIVCLISAFYTLLFAVTIGVISFNLSRADSLSSFEGSMGEGSPIAIIVGLVMFTLIFFLPWLICSIRLMKRNPKANNSCHTTSYKAL